jgi:hypothetical protein
MKTVFTILFLCSVCFGQGVKSTAPLPNDPNGVKSAEPLPNDSAAVSQAGKAIHLSKPVTVGPATFNIQTYRPQSFVISDGTKNIVTISTETGEVKYGEGVTLTEASRKFYEEVGKLFRNTLCDAQAGAHSEPTGKPDSEKTKKPSGEASR